MKGQTHTKNEHFSEFSILIHQDMRIYLCTKKEFNTKSLLLYAC